MDDTYDKESMLNIHTNLMTHPTKNTFFISNFAYDRIQILRQNSEDYLNINVIINDNNMFIVKFRISSIVNFYNRNSYIKYLFYHS